MQIHQIQRTHKNKTKKRVGRGGVRGSYSGGGIKGQKVHGGRSPRPELRDIIKKIPKKRGYRFTSIQTPAYPVNISAIEASFQDGDVVTPQSLAKKGVLTTKKGERPRVKILGNGTLTKKVTIERCTVSASAKEKIEKAGGSIK